MKNQWEQRALSVFMGISADEEMTMFIQSIRTAPGTASGYTKILHRFPLRIKEASIPRFMLEIKVKRQRLPLLDTERWDRS